jgi:hypothetical protein
MTYQKKRDFVLLPIASMGLVINSLEFGFKEKGKNIKKVKKTF